MKNIGAPILLILSLSSSAFAGKEGGGGGAYVCRDAATKVVQTVELVDLWEARELGGQTIVYDDVMAPEKQLEAAIARLGKFFPPIANELLSIKLKIKPASSEALPIPPPDDVKSRFTKAGCPLEGMMYFDDVWSSLIIDQSLFSGQRTKTDLAASYFHEILYKYLRTKGATDSVYTRHVVGCMFSSDPTSCLNLSAATLPKNTPVWSCSIPAVKIKGSKPTEVPKKYSALSFYIWGDQRPISSSTGTDTSLVITRFGDTDFSSSDVRTAGSSSGTNFPGSARTSFFSIYFDITHIYGDLYSLGNPLGIGEADFSVRAISYNPLTLMRDDIPENMRQPTVCKLIEN